MNILFIMLAFPKFSIHSMYTDLVRKFYDEGHNVYPIAPLCKDVTKTGIFLDLSEQTLRMYKDGKLVLESPVITGNNGDNGTISHKTPTGKYLLYKSEKKSPATLRGSNDDGSKYASHVDYWMPFITSRGIGFHDATWRSNSQFYNKNTYLTSGSHACVNMPLENAAKLYNLITSNIDVYVFN